MQTLLSNPRHLPRVSVDGTLLVISPGAAATSMGMYQNLADLTFSVDRPSISVTGGRVVLNAIAFTVDNDIPAVRIRATVRQSEDGNAIPPGCEPGDLTLAVFDAYPDGRILVRSAFP